MTEKELGKALLHLDLSTTPPDPRQLTREVLARDQRQVRLLAGLTTLLWVLTTASVCFLVWAYFMVVEPRLGAYAAGRAHLENDWEAWRFATVWFARIVLGCVLLLLLAGMGTVRLITASRRATLRQINASLMEISEQLKQLRPPLSTERGAVSEPA